MSLLSSSVYLYTCACGVYVACQTGPNLLLSRLEGGTNEKGERSPGLAYTYVDVVRHCCCYINHPIR